MQVDAIVDKRIVICRLLSIVYSRSTAKLLT